MAKIKAGAAVGEWTLMKPIACGGNGDVWLASKPKTPAVAIKLLRRLDDISYQRFRNEVQALKDNADIAGIIPITDSYLPADKTEGRPWYAMPLAKDCAEFLKGKSPTDVASYYAELADTLAALHARGISHRDIKPQNILALDGRLCLSDFGLVKYPKQPSLTPVKRDVGPKFTMAPEMRRLAHKADGLPADVFSLSKSLWISLTGVELGFDGQYGASSSVGLDRLIKEQYIAPLDGLMAEATDSDPLKRPSAANVASRLREWVAVVGDFHQRNQNEWTDALKRLFPHATPSSATWTEVNQIIDVLHEIGRINSLNHMFFPDGGGNNITAVQNAGEDGFIAIKALGTYILKPRKLTFESFGTTPEWNYLRLEAEEVEPTGIYDPSDDEFEEFVTETWPGKYEHRDRWEYSDNYDDELPETARPVSRYRKGSFVIVSTRSPYNLDSSTYDARHHQMGEEKFREYMARNAQKAAMRRKLSMRDTEG